MRGSASLILLMIFCYVCRQEPSTTFTREVSHSNGMERDVKAHSQTLGKAWGTRWKRREEGLKEPEGSRTPQENLQNQLTWAHRGSEKPNCQPEGVMGWTSALCTDVTVVQQSLHAELLKQEQWLSLKNLLDSGSISPKCIVWP